MDRKFHFVYRTTNLVNGKQYIGDHSTNNLNDRYLGSGQLIIKALYKYGKENFKREILEQFSSKKEAFDAQEKYILENKTLYPDGYNLSPKGGHNVKGCIGEETKKKLSLAFKGKDTWMKGKHHSEFSKQLLSSIHTGKPLSKEHRESIAKGNTGKHHTEIVKEKIRTGNIGKVASQESKEKMSLGQKLRKKVKCPHCLKECDPGNYGKYHGDKCKIVF